jgi:hypothetical protein
MRQESTWQGTKSIASNGDVVIWVLADGERGYPFDKRTGEKCQVCGGELYTGSELPLGATKHSSHVDVILCAECGARKGARADFGAPVRPGEFYPLRDGGQD